MKTKIINWFIKNKISFELTQIKGGNEVLIINHSDRVKPLDYCIKNKLLEDFQYKDDFTKVHLIFKKHTKL